MHSWIHWFSEIQIQPCHILYCPIMLVKHIKRQQCLSGTRRGIQSHVNFNINLKRFFPFIFIRINKFGVEDAWNKHIYK